MESWHNVSSEWNPVYWGKKAGRVGGWCLWGKGPALFSLFTDVSEREHCPPTRAPSGRTPCPGGSHQKGGQWEPWSREPWELKALREYGNLLINRFPFMGLKYIDLDAKMWIWRSKHFSLQRFLTELRSTLSSLLYLKTVWGTDILRSVFSYLIPFSPTVCLAQVGVLEMFAGRVLEGSRAKTLIHWGTLTEYLSHATVLSDGIWQQTQVLWCFFKSLFHFSSFSPSPFIPL